MISVQFVLIILKIIVHHALHLVLTKLIFNHHPLVQRTVEIIMDRYYKLVPYVILIVYVVNIGLNVVLNVITLV